MYYAVPRQKKTVIIVANGNFKAHGHKTQKHACGPHGPGCGCGRVGDFLTADSTVCSGLHATGEASVQLIAVY